MVKAVSFIEASESLIKMIFFFMIYAEIDAYNSKTFYTHFKFNTR